MRRSIAGNRPADGADDKAKPVNNMHKDIIQMQEKEPDVVAAESGNKL